MSNGPQVLTQGEREIATLVGRGHSTKEIGRLLGTSESSIRSHLTRIYRKLGLRSRAHLAAWAFEHGIV